MQDLVLAVNLKKVFLVGNSPTHCFITCYTSDNYIERETNLFLSSPNGCPDKCPQNLQRHLNQDNFACQIIFQMLISKEGGCPFCYLLRIIYPAALSVC